MIEFDDDFNPDDYSADDYREPDFDSIYDTDFEPTADNAANFYADDYFDADTGEWITPDGEVFTLDDFDIDDVDFFIDLDLPDATDVNFYEV